MRRCKVEAEDWVQVEDWFHRLAPMDEVDRTRQLRKLESFDAGLAEHVESLLEAHDGESALDRLAAKLNRPTHEP